MNTSSAKTMPPYSPPLALGISFLKDISGRPRNDKKQKSIQPINGIRGTTVINVPTGGYLPFNQGPPLYHRLLWISISHSEAFGEQNFPTRSSAARKLIMHHPRGQYKYISLMRICTIKENVLQFI